MKWFTADWHLYHHNIIRYSQRPFKDINQMHIALQKNFNELVVDSDDVYFLGDIFWGNQFEKFKKYLDNLHGRKHLILGNHDELKPFTYVSMGFTSVHTALKVNIVNEEYPVILTHDPAIREVNHTTVHLCGHVHHLFRVLGNTRNVGVDVNEYAPVSEITISDWMQSLPEERKNGEGHCYFD